jgi:hypothetical protein
MVLSQRHGRVCAKQRQMLTASGEKTTWSCLNYIIVLSPRKRSIITETQKKFKYSDVWGKLGSKITTPILSDIHRDSTGTRDPSARYSSSHALRTVHLSAEFSVQFLQPSFHFVISFDLPDVTCPQGVSFIFQTPVLKRLGFVFNGGCSFTLSSSEWLGARALCLRHHGLSLTAQQV